MAPKRPREQNNLPPAKRSRMIVNSSINRLVNNFTKKLNIPKDSYNLGTITSLTNTNMGVRLSRRLVNDLKNVYRESYERQIEHVGSTQFTVKNTRGYVKFMTPSRRTNERFDSVMPSTTDIDSYVVYHSHPVPPGNRMLFTIPSVQDIREYVRSYPHVQANIILEKHGYYVVDLIESDVFNKPNADDVVRFYNSILDSGKFNRVLTVHRNIMFFNSDATRWKKTINGYVNKLMRSKFGISIRYYTYDELADITLIDKNKIMIP
jgi:hypothetical protein